MESKRQQQFARLIREELSDIFLREAKHWFGNAFITVTAVRVTPDLAIARIYLSFLQSNGKEALLEEIQEKAKQMRNVLGQRIRQSVRVIPELQFFADDTAEYAARIETLLSGLNIPPANE
jgi:ribosome-binding factor A